MEITTVDGKRLKIIPGGYYNTGIMEIDSRCGFYISHGFVQEPNEHTVVCDQFGKIVKPKLSRRTKVGLLLQFSVPEELISVTATKGSDRLTICWYKIVRQGGWAKIVKLKENKNIGIGVLLAEYPVVLHDAIVTAFAKAGRVRIRKLDK